MSRRVPENGRSRPTLTRQSGKRGWQRPWLVGGDLNHDHSIKIPCPTSPSFEKLIMVEFPTAYIKECMSRVAGYPVIDSDLIGDLMDAFRRFVIAKGVEPEAVESMDYPEMWFRPIFGSTHRLAGGMMAPGPVRVILFFAVPKVKAMRPKGIG